MRHGVMLLVLLLSGTAARGSGGEGYSITGEQVCRALNVDEHDCPVAVEIFGHPVASAPGVKLQAAHATRSRFGQQVTLRCDGSRCLPFLVLLHQSPARDIAVRPPARVEPRAIAVRPGERAELVQTGNGIRLTRTVICAERGHIGDVIRVREAQGRQVLRAAVVGPGRLVATF